MRVECVNGLQVKYRERRVCSRKNRGGFAYDALVEVEEEIPIVGRVKGVLYRSNLCILWDLALVRQMVNKAGLIIIPSRFKKKGSEHFRSHACIL